MSDSTVKTLHKVCDWIVNESCEDYCQICAYYDKNKEYEDLDKMLEEDIEPCIHKRTKGATACRNGIIEHFQKEGHKK